MGVLKQERNLVIPGEKLYEGNTLFPGHGTFKEGNSIFSRYLGIVEFRQKFVRVIPFKGRYIPKDNDLVIGSVIKVSHSSWIIELNSPYSGIMPVSEGTEEFIDLNEKSTSDLYDVGDVVLVKIKKVSPTKDVLLTMKDRITKKINGGLVVNVSPTKVPRLIGKGGTMVSTIKDKTRCIIMVGQNGRVWVKGENEELAVEAIRKVEKEAHISGLTEKIAKWLDEQIKGKKTAKGDESDKT